MPTIQLDKLVKRYGEVEVLHGIELEMADNEFTVLVGPSGCGKSTTLRMIAGLEDVSGGEIYVGGDPVSHLEPKERDLAMVFQDYALYPHMNVAQNISFALRLARRPKAEIDAKVREVAATVGLTEFLHRKPGALSGGQRQRVAMARALAKDSAIFLFDEPLSNLDAKLRGQMRAELALMSQQVEKNMIYVTHDQIEAMTLADRIVVMHGGYIQQQGLPGGAVQAAREPVRRGVLGLAAHELSKRRGRGALTAECSFTATDLRFISRAQRPRPARSHRSKSVVLGIRPSDLRFDPEAPDEKALTLDVKVSEYIGAQSVLLCQCGSASVMVELNSETPVALGPDAEIRGQSERGPPVRPRDRGGALTRIRTMQREE